MPIIHELNVLYKELYSLRKQIGKMERYGIYQKIENNILNCLELSIAAALTAKDKKLPLISKLKLQIEIAKRLTRLMWELKIITDNLDKSIIKSGLFLFCAKSKSNWPGIIKERKFNMIIGNFFKISGRIAGVITYQPEETNTFWLTAR